MDNERKTNPYGANQYTLDPRQKLCWEKYTNPKSETFGNAKASAIAVGYTEGTADTITSNDWFIGKLWQLNATYTGEKKMKELMEYSIIDENGKVDVGLARIQADLAKYLTSTQGKNEGYSTRVENTGKDGAPLQVIVPAEVAAAFNINATHEKTEGSNTQ